MSQPKSDPIEIMIHDEKNDNQIKKRAFDILRNSKRRKDNISNNTFNYNEEEEEKKIIQDNSDLSDSESNNETNRGSNNSDNEEMNYKSIYIEDITNRKINIQGDTPKRVYYRKLNYREVENKIDKYYFDINHKYSSALDILASYLKGHKIIYMESKHYSEKQLNRLMMPAILLSTCATVISATVTDCSWGGTFISAINGVIVFLLSLVNYFKLDAAAEAYKISSHQYDKLQSTVEFTSGSVLLFRECSNDKIFYN